MDVHMMVSNPEQWVDDIAEAGGALYCFHIEASCMSLPPVNLCSDSGDDDLDLQQPIPYPSSTPSTNET